MEPLITHEHISPPVPAYPSKLKYLLATLIIGVFLIGIISGYFLTINYVASQQVRYPNTMVSPTVMKTTRVSPNILQESMNENTGIPNQKKYTSQRLGVSFLYLDKIDTETVAVKEEGNRIYIYTTRMPYTDGQYVEVHTKEPAVSLVDTIKTQFLTGYSEKDCLVDVETIGAIEKAEIRLPMLAADDAATRAEKAKKCPSLYTVYGGNVFFLHDKRHPDRFLFFKIGQYAILASDDTTWQDTIKILEK